MPVAGGWERAELRAARQAAISQKPLRPNSTAGAARGLGLFHCPDLPDRGRRNRSPAGSQSSGVLDDLQHAAGADDRRYQPSLPELLSRQFTGFAPVLRNIFG